MRLTKAGVIAAIRANHLKANIGWIEDKGPKPRHKTGRRIFVHWGRAWIDGGNAWIYLHVPITGYYGGEEETTQRIYPPARLRRKLAAQFWKAYKPPSADAVDPHADSTGTPST